MCRVCMLYFSCVPYIQFSPVVYIQYNGCLNAYCPLHRLYFVTCTMDTNCDCNWMAWCSLSPTDRLIWIYQYWHWYGGPIEWGYVKLVYVMYINKSRKHHTNGFGSPFAIHLVCSFHLRHRHANDVVACACSIPCIQYQFSTRIRYAHTKYIFN